jgi:hypothetical protein
MGGIAEQTDELKIGVLDDPPDHFGAHIARGELENPKRLLRHRHSFAGDVPARMPAYGRSGHLSR